MIDLRSDTVTQPTPEMRRAMAEAPVGDDVLGDDPTVNRLEARVAEVLGKEAAVYMPSGTMTNEVALRAHTEPGDEILMHKWSHVHLWEGGGPAALAGCSLGLLDGPRGLFGAAAVNDALHAPGEIDPHKSTQKLVVIENTQNRGGGAVWPIEQVAEVEAAARAAGLKMHMDGARLWNAAVAAGVSEAEYARHFDSVSVCFSKGLGAPVGSALSGSREFVTRARRFRKLFGGGMRQAGIIAAGALHALEHHRARLAEDHANAKRLAEMLAGCDGVEIDPAEVETNLVFFQTKGPAEQLVRFCADRDVGVIAMGQHLARAVTHLGISAEQVERAGRVICQACRG